MGIILVQTNTAATDGQQQACSAVGLGPDGATALQATQNGTPGGTQTVDNGATNTENLLITWESAVGEPSQTTWSAGAWLINLQVTGGTGVNNLYTVNKVYVCRLNSAGVSQATVGTGTPAQLITGAAIYQFTVSGASQNASVSDKIWVGITLTCSSALLKTLIFSNSKTIVTPLSGGPPTRTVQVRQSGLLVAGTPVTVAM